MSKMNNCNEDEMMVDLLMLWPVNDDAMDSEPHFQVAGLPMRIRMEMIDGRGIRGLGLVRIGQL